MMNSGAIIVDTARTKLLKQANHAGTSRLMGFSEDFKINYEQYHLRRH
jgi:hypothetical protein